MVILKSLLANSVPIFSLTWMQNKSGEMKMIYQPKSNLPELGCCIAESPVSGISDCSSGDALNGDGCKGSER